ncbi:type III restriction protein, res subunit [Alkaliphilus metalliredigens QYMF]|uniref:Type III restriction protein, res subunit n=1 Tax=Alkaliphilus metalliredigens (strain QYMF) TaxID=293826 RepID=A6TLK4_ALKMQ|nr:type I restriction-modification system endonuclease [Alkaliphilus metalliredigens]ABR47072.1 type III restriction protein, res subunit [Alkaliphilus metalliredigens QYMF]
MKSNFEFLNKTFPVLANLGSTAESYLYSDANSSLIKLGLFGETIVNLMLKLDQMEPPEYDNTHANRIKLLKKEGLISQNIDDIIYSLRIARNKAVHSGYDSFEDCVILLEMGHNLAIWFMQTYGDWQYAPAEFVLPEDNSQQADFEALLKEKEELIAVLTEKVLKQKPSKTLSSKERLKRAASASEMMKLSEKETRYLIDAQLRKVGWEVDTVNLRYSKGTRPQKGKNIAIAEWPTNSSVGDHGYADYVLFIGLKLVGIIEAKRMFLDIPSVLDYQCKDYAKNIKDEHAEYMIDSWGEYKAPLLFATNGRKYLKQLETKSGIWFLDVRKPANIPKAQQGWMSPDGILELLEKDIEAANASLEELPYDLLRDKDGLNLREYQIDAIEAAEKAIIEGKQTALLSMATGTGKTRTVLGMIYRFLKTGRFKRILFLVDRSALGEQAQDVFKEVKLEDLMTLDEIYNIKNLEDRMIDKETKIQVATVQSLVKRILDNQDETMPSIIDYDLIVIDEAHRGYILDKEMDEDEILYRNQDDYISKYRAVIEYFDSVKIALTATPALHTSEIFGKPVYNYTYREAVVEGYLVDHDAPHTIVTKLSKEGINYEKGETVAIYDPVTGEIMNSDELEDELKFDVEKFNRQVITESFNRTVLIEISKELDPEGEGKTLIYAVDDSHADLIVKILKEIFEPYGVDNDAIMKITGSVGGGNKKKVLEAVKRFKNEKYPNIAVTVDLLTTGIDVPEITTLVFMRRVKSRILFEQMMGRATRLCPEIGKTHFEIYDPIGVYESLQPVNTMKPVVANPSTSFEDLLTGLEVLPTEKQIKNQIDMIIAKLQRKKRSMNEKTMAHFIDLSGGQDPTEFIGKIKGMSAEDAKEHIIKNKKLFDMLKEGTNDPRRAVVISDKEDELLSHTRGYGEGKKPEDYLEEFKTFITNNFNKIVALNIVCTRPKELTRDSLKSLKLELDRHMFTEQQLNTAWKEVKNQDIAADIISFIRQQAIGSTLLSHEERIKNAVDRLKKNHDFNKMELGWIERIEKNLLLESILDQATFETGSFKTAGGYNKINKIFKNQLDDIIQELNEYLYDDGGSVA